MCLELCDEIRENFGVNYEHKMYKNKQQSTVSHHISHMFKHWMFVTHPVFTGPKRWYRKQ